MTFRSMEEIAEDRRDALMLQCYALRSEGKKWADVAKAVGLHKSTAQQYARRGQYMAKRKNLSVSQAKAEADRLRALDD